ncbi:MAG: 3-oxoacyl-[acyl-carrier-protein] reductase [Thermodesulfobacteriota bacterium]
MTDELRSMFSLQGKTALVTGGSRGIGRAICLTLAQAGASVAINYRSGEEAAKETQSLLDAARAESTLAPFDVSDPNAVNKGVGLLLEKWGRIDVLVNNAGVSRDGLIGRMKDADWDEVVGTNMAGAFYVCRAVSRSMIRNRQGRIVNVASAAGEVGNAGQANYSAAKAGLIGLTKALARELAPRNILVNAVSPGIIAEGMSEHLTEAQIEAIQTHVPLRRLGTSEEVAAAVLFLCSPMAGYISGQVIRVNGGLYM